jgi:DUF1680 family protein
MLKMKLIKGELMIMSKTIIAKDLESLYLGNLRTVEFDLSLPEKGKFGSTFTWHSNDERFITNQGVVTRPEYGKGDRVIPLTVTAKYKEFEASKIYKVNVLEEENDIQIEQIFPVNLQKVVGESFYLPQAVAVKTTNQEIFSHPVVWTDEEELILEKPGNYSFSGQIKDTAYEVTATVSIVLEKPVIPEKHKQIAAFPMKSVRLTNHSMLKEAQDRRLEFLLSVDDNQMLYNFRMASGLSTKGAQEMIGWDSPDSLLKGHTTGHYLSALALCYGATGNKEIYQKLNYMIQELSYVQKAFEKNPAIHSGFLSAYTEEQFDLLEEYTPYPAIWAPYYTLHKLFAGLLDSYRIGGITEGLAIADKLGDWTYHRLNRLPHQQLKKMWSMYIAGEFGGMNESLAQLYEYTGKKEHLKTAKLFDNDRLFFPMEQKIDALGSLHANQHIPQIIGALKIYDQTKEDAYFQIADFFWKSVTSAHIYSIGGTGDGEMFQQPHLIGSKIDEHTAETCASYNLLKLTKELYEYEPTVEKMDYYERTMINHILSSTDHECNGGSTYFMPTSPGSKKGFDVENSCCHGTGLENHFKYGESIFFSNEENLVVNLFVSSRLSDERTGLTVDMDYDENEPEKVSFQLTFIDRAFNVRIPYWSKKIIAVWVNETIISYTEKDGYLVIEGLNNGDRVSIEFDIHFRLEETPDRKELFSLAYGPYILAVLSDKESFIEFDQSQLETTALQAIKKETGTLNFSLNDLFFTPLAKVNEEHYHLYLKKS